MVVRGVCIMRIAWRFSLLKKPEAVLLSPASTASNACFPVGLSTQSARAAKLTSGVESLSAVCSAARASLVPYVLQAFHYSQAHVEVFIMQHLFELRKQRSVGGRQIQSGDGGQARCGREGQ